MEVYFYDVIDKLALGNAIKCNLLQDLLKKVDVVTIHVDGRKTNENLIGEKEFKLMKDGAIFLNLSRGFIVDLQALAANIKSGKLPQSGRGRVLMSLARMKKSFPAAYRNFPMFFLLLISGAVPKKPRKISVSLSVEKLSILSTLEIRC